MAEPLSRRRMLGLGAAAVAGGIGLSAGSSLFGGATAAASDLIEADAGVLAQCANPSTLSTHTSIGGARCMAEGGGAANILINESFFQRLVAWREFWYTNTPYPWSSQVWNYGAYSRRDGSCKSWHEAGRALDLTSVRDATTTMQFWCRYDVWKDASNAAAHRLKYWAGAASLHSHFRSVLTYLYNQDHWNHIHIDNGESGTGLTTFSTSSKAQVQAVQGICGNIWGRACGTDGVWDSAVAVAAAQVLTRIGKGGSLTTSQSHWQAFLRASVRQATGKQAY